MGNTDRRKVEILAELPCRDARLQVPVGGGHHAHVDVKRAGSSDALEAPFFERPENLRLEGERQVADLIQEQRSAVRHLEAARFALRGAGEGPFLVTEQLGLEQGLGNRRAIDRHERPVGPRAEHVQRPGKQLLPGAALALQ